MLKAVTTQTAREKQAGLEGVNLFFGALLGANLGTVTGLDTAAYALLITVLAGTVMSLHLFIGSERRKNAWLLLGIYVAFLIYVFAGFSAVLDGISVEQRERFGVTFAIWIGAILLTEFMPIQEVDGNNEKTAPSPATE